MCAESGKWSVTRCLDQFTIICYLPSDNVQGAILGVCASRQHNQVLCVLFNRLLWSGERNKHKGGGGMSSQRLLQGCDGEAQTYLRSKVTAVSSRAMRFHIARYHSVPQCKDFCISYYCIHVPHISGHSGDKII